MTFLFNHGPLAKNLSMETSRNSFEEKNFVRFLRIQNMTMTGSQTYKHHGQLLVTY